MVEGFPHGNIRNRLQGGFTKVIQLVDMWLKFRAQFARDDEKGASLVEYALLVALIAVVCIVAIQFLGNSASSQFSNVGSAINS